MLRALLVWTVWIFSWPSWIPSTSADDVPGFEPIPLWQQGISRWNGSGYDLPVSTSTAVAPDIAPYTMPIDPKGAKVPAPSGAKWMPGSSSPLGGQAVLPEISWDDSTVKRSEPAVSLTAPENLDSKPPRPTSSQESAQELPAPVKDQTSTEKAIGEAIEAGELGVEQAPLEQEVTRWYQYPQRWMRGWNSHAEFGLDGSSGNSETLAMQTGLEMKRQTDVYTLFVDIDYRQASNKHVLTEDNGRLNMDYDQLVAESKWSGFGKLGLEWDRFKSFDLRLNLNSGVGYHWIREAQSTLVTRFGAGASKEIGAPIDRWIAEAVFGIEAERQLNSRQKLKGRVDYFPAWEDFSNYRVVTDLAWEILLNDRENLSLKLAATDRYDSTPQGARPNDVYYSMLLLYKF